MTETREDCLLGLAILLSWSTIVYSMHPVDDASSLLLCFLLCCFAFSFACLPLLSVLCYCCSLLLVTVLSPFLSPLPLCRYFAISAHCCSEHVMIAWCLSLDSVCVCSALLACVCFLLLFLSSLLIHPFLYLVHCTLLFFLYLLSSVHIDME